MQYGGLTIVRVIQQINSLLMYSMSDVLLKTPAWILHFVDRFGSSLTKAPEQTPDLLEREKKNISHCQYKI